ncbi:MAG: LPS export ABC transporter periplasmic protein LptC [Flavobacteriaceae bacterium]
MKFLQKKYYLKVAVATATFFWSCDFDKSEQLSNTQFKGEPSAVAYDIRMVYTDSLKVKAILTAQEHRDYSNLSLQHSIFPKGLKVVFIDEFKRENIITADYGTLYNSTSIIDLQGNVVLQTSDGGILKTPQLFWDAKTDWIFTEETFNFSNPEYDVVATRLDTNKEFTKFKTGKLTGTVAVQEDNNE